MGSCDYFVRTSLRIGFLLEIVVAAFDVCRFCGPRVFAFCLKVYHSKRTWFYVSDSDRGAQAVPRQMIKSCDM